MNEKEEMETTLERSIFCEEEEISGTKASGGCGIKLGCLCYFYFLIVFSL